jgi:hypothetical protein
MNLWPQRIWRSMNRRSFLPIGFAAAAAGRDMRLLE